MPAKSLQEGASFFFANLPYHFESGFYTQAIIPLHDDNRAVKAVLNIVRDVTGKELRMKKEDLFNPLLSTQNKPLLSL